MDKIKNLFNNLTVEELKDAVLEIADKNENRLYKPNGVIRTLQIRLKDIINDNHYPIEAVEKAITWEISRRWYDFIDFLEGKIID
jgi:hypothetical protein